jgi:hypothetical protein
MYDDLREVVVGEELKDRWGGMENEIEELRDEVWNGE